MTQTRFMVRGALAAATLALSFALTPALAARSEQPAPADMPMACSSPAVTGKDCSDCKKIYQTEHHGAPGKGIDVRTLVRVECPTQPPVRHR